MTAAEPSPLVDTDLPEGWADAHLGDGITVDIQPGFACGNNNRTAEGIGHVRPMNVSVDGKIDLSDLKFVPKSEVNKREERLLRMGDVVFNNTNSHELVGKTAFYNLAQSLAFSNHMTRIRCRDDALAPSYCGLALHYLWKTGYFQSVCNDHVSQSSVGRGVLSKTRIALAPLAEQKRIVEKVEQLVARVNAGRKRLASVPVILKRFRQAVLAAACSGRLTAEWRANNPKVRDVNELILSIRMCRSKSASSSENEKLKGIYDYLEENDSAELPENWRFVALKKLCTSFDYGTSAKSHPSGRIPVLRMGNLQNGEIDWSNLVYTSDKTEIEKYSLKPNTVLFNRTNSADLVGKTAIFRGGRPAIFAGYLIRIVNLPELIPQYLNICLNTPYAREFCSRVKADAVSQSNINAQKLAAFEIPYCVPDEQREIVRRVEALFKLADAIEKRVAAATARTDKLTQSILAKAFRGELVPTEAELARREGRSYEPASVLLDRIRTDGR